MEKKIEGGDAIVVGGGALGCAIARSLAMRGLSVVLVEGNGPGTGATWAAAGMLAPLGEAEAPGDFLELGLESLRLYPDFAAEVERESGEAVGFLRSGKLQVAFNDEEVSALRARERWAARVSPDVEWVASEALHGLEPALSRDARAGLLIPRDYQVDNRRLGAALWTAAGKAGARHFRGDPVREVRSDGGRTRGVILESGTMLEAPHVVLAAGCWSSRIGGLPRPLPVRPVRGQMLALDSRDTAITRMIATPDVYLVPRGDGTLLVGATVEEAGFDARTTAAGIRALLDAAIRAAPLLGAAPVREVWAGLRPGTPDGLPILGEDPDRAGLFYAMGHFRNGILLTPVTARIITELILGDAPSIPCDAFRPERFLDGSRGVGGAAARPGGAASRPGPRD